MKKKKIIKAQLGRIIKDNLSPQQKAQLEERIKDIEELIEKAEKETVLLINSFGNQFKSFFIVKFIMAYFTTRLCIYIVLSDTFIKNRRCPFYFLKSHLSFFAITSQSLLQHFPFLTYCL